MLIRLTRLTNERHRLELVRDDGTREARELETRSALPHDLVHYAVETEAGLGGDLIARVRERLRRVQGQWRATPFHRTLVLEFPPASPEDRM